MYEGEKIPAHKAFVVISDKVIFCLDKVTFCLYYCLFKKKIVTLHVFL